MKSCNVIFRESRDYLYKVHVSIFNRVRILGRLQYSTVEIHVHTISYMYIGTGACSGDYEIP